MRRSLISTRAKVTLVNLNVVRIPAVAPYALDVLGSALEDAGHEVRILDLTREDDWVSAIPEHFASFTPDLVGVSMRNNNDLYFPSYGTKEHDGSFVPTHAAVIARIKEHVDPARIVIGGVGYSTAPLVLREYGLTYGIRGPGDRVLPLVASAFAANGHAKDLAVPKEDHGDVVLFDGRRDPLHRRVRRTFVDNPWYYRVGGLGNIRTNNGCGMRCVYCSDPYAKGPVFTNSGVDDVLYEIDQLVEQKVFDLHTTDSEFNMPINHAKSVLRGIVDRGYPKELRLWAYGQPKPWDEEYTRLLVAANVTGVNLGSDHTDPEMLKALGKWFGPDDIARTNAMCKEHGVAVMHELLFGYPGDTPEKMYRSIEFVLRLDPRVIGVAIGFAVTPGTPMGVRFDELRAKGGDLTGYYFRGEPYVNPVYYVDPSFDIPAVYEDLKRFLGSEVRRVMIPKPVSERTVDDPDNQLVNSRRVGALLESQKKGAYWYYFAD